MSISSYLLLLLLPPPLAFRSVGRSLGPEFMHAGLTFENGISLRRRQSTMIICLEDHSHMTSNTDVGVGREGAQTMKSTKAVDRSMYVLRQNNQMNSGFQGEILPFCGRRMWMLPCLIFVGIRGRKRTVACQQQLSNLVHSSSSTLCTLRLCSKKSLKL